MNLLNPVAQRLVKAESFLDADFRQEVVGKEDFMLRTDTVNATEALNQTDRVPMKIIVDDVVAVLKVQTFGQNIGCDDRAQFHLAFGKLILRVCLRRKSSDHTSLALFAAIDDLHV